MTATFGVEMKTHIKILLMLNISTLMFSAYNSYVEELPSLLFYFGTVIGAIASGIISSTIFVLISKRARRTNYPFGVVAYVSTGLGTLAYLYYALNGKADSMHSAAHMHVVMFPLLHGFLAICGLTIAGLISFIPWSAIFNKSNSTEPNA